MNKNPWENPDYLFKKKNYTRRKRRELREKHKKALAAGVHGASPSVQHTVNSISQHILTMMTTKSTLREMFGVSPGE